MIVLHTILVDFTDMLPLNGAARFDEVDFQIAYNEMLESDSEPEVNVEIEFFRRPWPRFVID